jgi:hypothetical protein
VTWDTVLYYAGYVVALFLCRGLGNIFFIPMLLNMIFNIVVQLGLLSGWDNRLVLACYGFLFFLWVAALAGIFDRVTVAVLLLADLFAAYNGLLPAIQAAGTGESFWHSMSTSIIQVWMMSILVVSVSAIAKSSVVSKWKRGYSALLTIPKRRFLIPIAMWAAVIVLGEHLSSYVPDIVVKNRFKIAALLLVWGWVAFELPFYIMYKRLGKNDA